jgi:hypothetical protein
MTPAKLADLAVSMTLVMHDITGVNDIGDMLSRCHWHQQTHASPVSMTPVSNFLPVSLTPVKISKTVKVSLTDVKELLTGVNDTGNACFDGVVDTGEAQK